MRKERYLSVPENIWSFRNYSERLSAYFNLEIQSDHFGNGMLLSFEGCNIDSLD